MANVRTLHNGMGQAVAERTVLRKKEDGSMEDWGDVARRVALGNVALSPGVEPAPACGHWKFEDRHQLEFENMRDLMYSGTLMMSGRHLQHGDGEQPTRNMEVFTNCATAPCSFLLFQLLLNGAGVGRCYDDDMMLVKWDNAPAAWCVLDEEHPDYTDSQHLSARNARHMFNGSKDMLWHEVADSREGWAKALELLETAAFEKVHRDKLLVLDFSKVRAKGMPIKGMQGRPSSGPVPLMNAFAKLSMIRGAGLPRWKQAMYVDHFFAECVLVGGARRAARISTKHWKDSTVNDFIKVKRPVEYDGLNMDGVLEYRAFKGTPLGFLWSSNNSVAVDAEFWEEHDVPGTWANLVFKCAMECAYADGTGEPGFVNVDMLHQDDAGWDDMHRGDYVGSKRYQPEDNSNLYLSKLAKRAMGKPLHMIVNPCGEIALNILGGYCTIAATAPYNARPEWEPGDHIVLGADDHKKEWDDRFEASVRQAARALIRVNTMDSLYGKEVRRTNRIGVGLIGIHEWLWARWGMTFREALDEEGARDMWMTVARMSLAALDESVKYSKEVGLPTPHTVTTIPPGGTISKMFGLTEGAHLPAMAEYLRWVQFRNDDPLVDDYRARGYPVRVLEQYKGHTIVGFPTQPVVAQIMPADKLVTAAEATVDEQYQWLKLLEKYWIEGGAEGPQYGNQVSYTLKYNPSAVTYEEFITAVAAQQSTVRCCAVMPQEDTIAFEYQPEQAITHDEYEVMVANIVAAHEDIDDIGMGCIGGACPVEFNVEKGVIGDSGYV